MSTKSRLHDPVFDAFCAGSLDKDSIQDRRLLLDGQGTYSPLYTIRSGIHEQIQALEIDAAALSRYLDETVVCGFKRMTGANVLIVLRSCRSMFLTGVWGCFDTSIDDACTIVKEYVGTRNWFPVHVPTGWSFERTREMVCAYNFRTTGRQDPPLDWVEDDTVFSRLSLPGWQQGVVPLAGSKFS